MYRPFIEAVISYILFDIVNVEPIKKLNVKKEYNRGKYSSIRDIETKSDRKKK